MFVFELHTCVLLSLFVVPSRFAREAASLDPTRDGRLASGKGYKEFSA